MAQILERLVVDCSVIVKWKITTEDYADEAEELLLDWQNRAVELCAPNLLQSEVMSAFLRAHRRGRVSEAEAKNAIRDLLALPFLLFDAASIATRAFEIAQQHNQRAYDCIYVALAEREGVELWTGDRRLYNVLHFHFASVRWIEDYQRKRS
ncbi:type II toxin-antitoxin system VapC family toxin [Candidatus Poribacteria bacterium]|nr:type II toxin-antitoxin system VapC family toxin [Candidatus Poribacteria bacterium]